MVSKVTHDRIASSTNAQARPVGRGETRSVAGRYAQRFRVADDLRRSDGPASDAAYYVAKADQLRADALWQAARTVSKWIGVRFDALAKLGEVGTVLKATDSD